MFLFNGFSVVPQQAEFASEHCREPNATQHTGYKIEQRRLGMVPNHHNTKRSKQPEHVTDQTSLEVSLGKRKWRFDLAIILHPQWSSHKRVSPEVVTPASCKRKVLCFLHSL